MATRRVDEDDDPITVNLGPLAARAEARMATGEYESVSDLLQEGLRALSSVRKRLVDRAANPKPSIPIDEAFARLREYAERRKAKRGLSD